jgi:hypothetical protein
MARILDFERAISLDGKMSEHGWEEPDFLRLLEGDRLAGFLEVLRGRADIVPRPVPPGAAGKGPYRGREGERAGGAVIDCSAEPHLPEGWEIRPGDQLASAFRGELVWTPDAARLHLDPRQENGGRIRGTDLREALEGQPVLPARVLDWLLENPEEIPVSWKVKLVYFWGTVYYHRIGGPVVRCLLWSGGRWGWNAFWLGIGWHDDEPAAVRAGVF